MARKHAQVLTSIWMNEDFLALSDDARLSYLFLLSQPDLSLVGVLVARPRVWARRGAPSSEEALTIALHELAEGEWLEWDRDTDEVWIQAFIKHNVAASPKALIGASKAAKAVVSASIREGIANSVHPDLRDGFVASFDDVGFTDLKARVRDLPAWTSTSRHHVDTPSDTPSRGGPGTPSTPSRPPPDTPSEGVSTTETRDLRPETRDLILETGDAAVRPAEASAGPQADPAASAEKPKQRPKPSRVVQAPASFGVTDDMRSWAAEKGIQGGLDAETERFLDHHRAKGSKFKDWEASWRTWMTNALEWHPERITKPAEHDPHHITENYR